MAINYKTKTNHGEITMTLYQKFKELKINLSAIGLEQSDSPVTYFCTPKGAKVIGWAGVDGIHYCTIRGFGDTIFAVSPMNLPGDYVHPIARNFEELLGLLMSCGSMAAIEQAHMWDKAQFDEYLKENLPTEEHTAVMNSVKEKFAIAPIDDPFSYIKNLQAAFDYSLIKYTPEYYDLDMNPAAEPEPPEWKVTYDGGFWKSKGRAGKEIPVEKTFFWGNEHWYIPAAYICSKGLVVDFCTDVAAYELKAYIDKWNLLNERSNHYSKEQQEQMQSEHPLNAEFDPHITLNGKELHMEHGYGVSWIPPICLNEEFQMETEAKHIIEHYGLDLNRGWSIRRYSFLWATKRTPVITSLKLSMKRRPVTIPGTHIISPSVGDTITFTHPATATQHTLTVHVCETQQLEQRHFRNENMEYPTHYTAMTYTLDPEISGQDFILRDYNGGDRPRLKNPRPNEFSPIAVSSVGIIGSADGPTMILLSNGDSAKTHIACSSLYFEQKENIEWYMSFNVKKMDDIEVELV